MIRGVVLATLMSAPLAAQQPPAANEAAALLRDSNFVAAARAYTALTTKEPSNPAHWDGLGRSELGQRQFARAEAAFLKAISLYPSAPPLPRRVAWYNLAATRARLGKLDEAFAALDSVRPAPWMTPQMLEKDPDLESLRSDPRMERLKRAVHLAAAPCDTMPRAREFDFWIGDWDVYAPNKTLAGRNEIQKISNGCALLENWTGRGGGTGKSLNFYNATTNYWQQTWIGSGGGPIEYRDGVLRDSTLTFIAKGTGPNNQEVLNRLSFTRLNANRVRQHAETSTDGGATWTTSYDFQYLRRGSDEKP